jgi:hypothetical protein
MRADAEILHDAYSVLMSNMDIIEVERFIILVKRDTFDYTEWRKDLWENLSVREISQSAMNFARQKRKERFEP